MDSCEVRAILLVPQDQRLDDWQIESLNLARVSGLRIVKVLIPDQKANEVSSSSVAATVLRALSGTKSKAIPKTLLETSDVIHWDGRNNPLAGSDPDLLIDFSRTALDKEASLILNRKTIRFYFNKSTTPTTACFTALLRKQSRQKVSLVISSKTSGTKVVAQGFCRLTPHSMKKSVRTAASLGTTLIVKAVRTEFKESFDFANMTNVEEEQLGIADLTRVIILSLSRLISRIIYGALGEKHWRVGYVPALFEPESQTQIDLSTSTPLANPRNVLFVADPVSFIDGHLFLEVMGKKSPRGKIAAHKEGSWNFLEFQDVKSHLSYPYVFSHQSQLYLLPEMAQSGPQRLFRLDPQTFEVLGSSELNGLESERLIDPTLLQVNNSWYLFAGLPASSDQFLHLWVSDELEGPWQLHSNSPVTLDPRGSRMAGPIVRKDGHLYRLGQDCTAGYGQSIIVHKIEDITPETYREREVGTINVASSFGPHTLTLTEGGFWFDYYNESWTLQAGVRRLISRILI